MAVQDVIIQFRGGPKFAVREHCEKQGYTKVTIDKSCNDLHMMGTGSDRKDGEIYFPMINIFRVAVDWIPGTARQS